MKLFKLTLLSLFCLALIMPSVISAQTESRKDLNVTATVPADPDDFSIDITQVTPGSNFPQNTEIEYKVDYSSSLSTAVNITVEAQWYPGETEDQQESVNVVNYLSGSATDGYGGAAPVIDTINNKITWTINSFPASESDSVNFKLLTNSNYQGSQIVTFNVKSRLIGPGFTTPDQSVSTTYKYNSPPAPTPTPTPGSPTPGPSATPTPTSIPELFEFTQIDVRTLTNTTAGIFIQTNQAASSIIRYGTNINSLSSSASSSQAISNLVTLSNLNPNTTYYFRVYSTNSNNNQIISDVYTFKTASGDVTANFRPTTFIATSNEAILTLISEESNENYIVIPVNTIFQFKFALENAKNAKSVQAVIRNKNVLGLKNIVEKADASTDLVNMVEIEPGIYAGNLMSKPEPGTYEIYARITEKNGTITEQKISEMKVTNKFTVRSKSTGKPIEGVRILLYILNQQTNKYQIIPDSALANGNPVFTDKNGEIPTVLPPAKYKAEISELGFKDVTINFTVGVAEDQSYPIVELDTESVNPLRLFRYYSRTFQDVFLFHTQIYAFTLSDSIRFFDLVGAIILISLVLLTFYAFSKKHHIPLSSIHSYFFYLLDKKDRSDKYIHGVIYDEDDKPISQANVYLTSEENEEIVSHVKTNKNGEFFFNKSALRQKNTDKFLLLVMKKGYRNTPLIKYDEKAHVKLKINLDKDSGIEAVKDNFVRTFERIFGMLFELLLLFSFLFELLFISNFGVIKVAPFLAISLFNLFLWTMHLRHKYYEF